MENEIEEVKVEVLTPENQEKLKKELLNSLKIEKTKILNKTNERILTIVALLEDPKEEYRNLWQQNQDEELIHCLKERLEIKYEYDLTKELNQAKSIVLQNLMLKYMQLSINSLCSKEEICTCLKLPIEAIPDLENLKTEGKMTDVTILDNHNLYINNILPIYSKQLKLLTDKIETLSEKPGLMPSFTKEIRAIMKDMKESQQDLGLMNTKEQIDLMSIIVFIRDNLSEIYKTCCKTDRDKMRQLILDLQIFCGKLKK